MIVNRDSYIGNWSTSSGNDVDVYLSPELGSLDALFQAEWERKPSEADLAEYRTMILLEAFEKAKTIRPDLTDTPAVVLDFGLTHFEDQRS